MTGASTSGLTAGHPQAAESSAGAGRRWAIVGGGMLGMTLAHRLAQHGQRVTLFEAAGDLGGLANAWRLGDVVWDRHYHVILLSDLHLRALLDELGLQDELRWSETKTGFFTDGSLYSMSNTFEFLRFPPLTPLQRLRLGLTIFVASRRRDWRQLETVPVVDWLRRWSGGGVLEKIWLPLLRAKLGENYRKTSAAFIWATINRMHAARRSGLKKEMFGYVSGGYSRILNCFGRRLVGQGVRIELNRPIQRVAPASEGGVRVEFVGDGGEHFDQVVLTVPTHAAAELCPDLSEQERARFQGIEYQGIVCASLLLKRPLADYYVTNITDPGLPFTAVIEMSALVDHQEFRDRSLIYLPKYVAEADGFSERSDDAIRALYLDALTRMYPHFHRDDVLAFRVSRVRHVMALPTLEYSRRLPPMRTSLPGVFFISSAQIVNGTLNVNETVRLGEEAFRNVLLKETELQGVKSDQTHRQPLTGPRQ